MLEDGVVILDSNVLSRLSDSSLRRKVLASLRTAGMSVRPTAITVLELALTPNLDRRFRLLDSLAELSCGSSVRPMPTKILEWTGRMIAEGGTSFAWPTSGMESLLYDRGIAHVDVIEAVRIHLEVQQRDFDSAMIRARQPMREAVAAQGSVDPWRSIQRFLEEQWNRMQFLKDEVCSAWRILDLPGEPDASKLLQNEAWRLYFESYGAVVYERTIHSQTIKPVQYTDIRQVVYLAGSNRRILVTDDGPLLRVAQAVLPRGYSGFRVLTSRAFIAEAS